MARRLMTLLALAPLLAAPRSVAFEAGGSVCVAPIEPAESLAKPPGGKPPSSYTAQIDDRPPIGVEQGWGHLESSLNLSTTHLVRIMGDGESRTSFRFTFTGGEGRDLCLWFNRLYDGWSLTPAKHRPKMCGCGRAR
jgi:hypothetical protein